MLVCVCHLHLCSLIQNENDNTIFSVLARNDARPIAILKIAIKDIFDAEEILCFW